MANKIEILENIIVKLLFRRGIEADRQSATFSLGEPAFTSDSKRLFVGDGTTPGGILVGNKFFGSLGSPPTTVGALSGDYFYNQAASKMFFLSGYDGSVASNWGPMA